MKGGYKLSTLSARFSAPSSSNPAHLPNEMQKGFISVPADDVATKASSTDLAIQTVIEQVIKVVQEVLPNAGSIEPPTCQCDNFCSHRRETVDLIICQAQEHLAERTDALREIRASAEERRQKALRAALLSTEGQWILHTRARKCAEIYDAKIVIRPLEVLTGPNNKSDFSASGQRLSCACFTAHGPRCHCHS